MRAIWNVWDGEGYVTTKQFFPLLSHMNWTPSATFTYIRRLEDKGYLRSQRSPTSRRENVYDPLITLEDWMYSESARLIKKTYGGMNSFLAGYVRNPNVSTEEIVEMQRILDEEMKNK